jgi:hypothetical protein
LLGFSVETDVVPISIRMAACGVGCDKTLVLCSTTGAAGICDTGEGEGTIGGTACTSAVGVCAITATSLPTAGSSVAVARADIAGVIDVVDIMDVLDVVDTVDVVDGVIGTAETSWEGEVDNPVEAKTTDEIASGTFCVEVGGATASEVVSVAGTSP